MWPINTPKKKSKVKNQKLKVKKLEWEEATDVKKDIRHLLETIDFYHINPTRIFCYRTNGSKSRSYARIWSFPKIFQHALKIEASYVIEVLSKYYDKLNTDEQKKVLIHELLHIPKNFSGALLPHRTKSRSIGKMVNELFKKYKSKI
ncbi:MAG: metallopeptidase [Candidatus Levyibacteriota bacterium]|nr:MAG: metallopeptidase [Candidatus Levybacteria bacterium]